MREFIKKHWLHLAIAAIPVVFICTYIWFVISGPVPVGEDLEKSDWLTFWGGFLSFTGSIVLGIVAVLQNIQANETNKRTIDDNRRMREIEFEHELKKNEYIRIIDGIREMHHRIFTIIEELNSTLKRENPTVEKSYIESVAADIKYYRNMEIDSILPPCYDKKYPALEDGKKIIKQTLEMCEQALRNSIKKLDAGEETVYNISIAIPQDAFLDLSSYFHNKLNDIQSYRSFVKEDLPDEQ